MNVSLKKSMYAAAALTVVLAGSYAWAGKAAVRQLIQRPSAEMKWEEFYPGGPVESFVVGAKDAKTGPTEFFIKFKAGFDSGWHVHESDYTGVVLSGTIIETSPGSEAAKPLTTGSYYMQPTVVHRTQCSPEADCYVYISEKGRFSFTPTDEAGKPLPPQAPAK
ncbi:MAG TPA: DUF4437 domain-containing protein [Myxococcaceae bacterium]